MTKDYQNKGLQITFSNENIRVDSEIALQIPLGGIMPDYNGIISTGSKWIARASKQQRNSEFFLYKNNFNPT